MSEVLAQLEKKGGGELSETTLWTNSSPSSSFVAQTITLSQSYTNFDKLRIYYRISTIANYIYYTDVDKTNWDNMVNGANKPRCAVDCANGDNTANYVRQFSHATETNVIISNATVFSGTTINNNYLLPQKICGLK